MDSHIAILLILVLTALGAILSSPRNEQFRPGYGAYDHDKPRLCAVGLSTRGPCAGKGLSLRDIES